jgi:hypothetical protein
MSEGLKWMQCPVCKETIYWEIPKNALNDITRFPIPIIINHKDHYIVCYVDSHFQIADAEVVVRYIEAKSKGKK